MKAKIYSKPTCPFCIKAKAVLTEKGIEFEDFDVSNDPELRQKISDSVGGHSTVPMIFLDGEFIGGGQDLDNLVASGKL